MKNFGEIHPFVLALYFLEVIVIAMFVPNPVICASALLGGACFLAVLRRGRKNCGGAGFYAAMFLLIAVTNPLFSHNGTTPLLFINGSPVTLEAAAYGVGLAATVVSVILWCACFSEIMTDDKFIYLTGRAIPKLSLILSSSMRLIPRFLRRMRTVRGAHRAIGMYGGKSYTERVRGALAVFYSLASWSAENSVATASAMKARGYGMGGRTNFSTFRFYKSDGALLVVSTVLTAAVLLGIMTGECSFSYYPVIAELPTSAFAVISYASFGALSMLPVMILAGGDIRWKYCVSRI